MAHSHETLIGWWGRLLWIKNICGVRTGWIERWLCESRCSKLLKVGKSGLSVILKEDKWDGQVLGYVLLTFAPWKCVCLTLATQICSAQQRRCMFCAANHRLIYVQCEWGISRLSKVTVQVYCSNHSSHMRTPSALQDIEEAGMGWYFSQLRPVWARTGSQSDVVHTVVAN